MKIRKTVIGIVVFTLFLFISGIVYAADLEIPHGDYEVWSANAEQTEFVLAFTGDYRWHVSALCLEPNLLPPSVGSICTYNGEIFTCPGAQTLGLLEILQQPPTPTVPFTPTPTATSTLTATATFTADSHLYTDGNLCTIVDCNLDTNADRNLHPDGCILLDSRTSWSAGI